MDFFLLLAIAAGVQNGPDMHYLLLLDEDRMTDAVRSHVTIVHTASPRLFVVRLVEAAPEEISALPGVAAVTNRGLPAELMSDLDDEERLFARAFASRTEPKERIGEGLPWDAPGFEPPDSLPDCQKDTADGGKTSAEPPNREGERSDGQ